MYKAVAVAAAVGAQISYKMHNENLRTQSESLSSLDELSLCPQNVGRAVEHYKEIAGKRQRYCVAGENSDNVWY